MDVNYQSGVPQKWLSMSSLGDQLLALEDNMPIILSHRKQLMSEEEEFSQSGGLDESCISPSPSGSCSSEAERSGAAESYEVVQQLDTSGYTSNNSSKDEAAGGWRSSSPESVLSGSINSDTLLTPFTCPTNNRKNKDIKVFAIIPTDTPQPTESTRFGNETPIEREIRIAKERDDELRLRNGLTNDLHPIIEATSKKSMKLHPSSDQLNSGGQDVQRRLATTRLQQEIEEQRRRELDLRRDGRVQSISEQHIDIPVIDDAITFPPPPSPVPQVGMIKQKQKELFETKQVTDGKVSSSLAKHSSETNLARNFLKENTSSAPKVSNMKVPISMEKFFNARGKGGAPSVVNAKAPVARNDVYVDYSAVRMRQSEESPAAKKSHRPAVNKISQELKDMQEREEELRSTRTRLGLLVLSAEGDSEVEHAVLPSRPESHMSNVSNSKDASEPAEFGEKAARRRSVLVAQWEERIQQQA